MAIGMADRGSAFRLPTRFVAQYMLQMHPEQVGNNRVATAVHEAINVAFQNDLSSFFKTFARQICLLISFRSR